MTALNDVLAISFYHEFCRFSLLPITTCSGFNQMVLARRLVVDPGRVCVPWPSAKAISLQSLVLAWSI